MTLTPEQLDTLAQMHRMASWGEWSIGGTEVNDLSIVAARYPVATFEPSVQCKLDAELIVNVVNALSELLRLARIGLAAVEEDGQRREPPLRTVTLTPEQLDALAALEQRATPAPWTPRSRDVGVSNADTTHNGGFLGWEIEPLETPQRGAIERGADAHLIATTRNLLPELLRLARLGLEAEQQEVWLRQQTTCFWCGKNWRTITLYQSRIDPKAWVCWDCARAELKGEMG